MRNFLLFCILFSFVQVQAQQTLEVYKRGTKKYYYFLAGDTIRLKVEGIKEPVTAPWRYVDKERIGVADTLIPLSAVSWVDISGKKSAETNWDLPASLLLIAGIGYFGVDQLNTVIETGRPVLNKQVVVTSAGLVAAGLLLKVISKGVKVKKARIGQKYVLRVWDHSS